MSQKANSNKAPFLLLHHWRLGPVRRAWTGLKILLKEGVIHGEWAEVFKNRQVGGHHSIPQGLEDGLEDIGYPYRQVRWPVRLSGDIAVVLQDPRALRWALKEKRRGRIKALAAGPLMVNLPNEAGEIFRDPAIDRRLFFSGWHRDLFMRLDPDAMTGAEIWFAGVDPARWEPSITREEREGALLYVKTDEPGLEKGVTEALRSRRIRSRVVRYSQYAPDVFREELDRSAFAVFLSRSETQGLAMMEAWSMDVPTLHWNPGTMYYQGRTLSGASSCWYLTPETGMSFPALEDFSETLDRFTDFLARGEFSPRDTVLARFTQEASARRMAEIVEGLRG